MSLVVAMWLALVNGMLVDMTHTEGWAVLVPLAVVPCAPAICHDKSMPWSFWFEEKPMRKIRI